MKKIGIMSMQRINNYGSFLQAYGLKRTINNLGYDVVFVDFNIEKPVIDEIKDSLWERILRNKNILFFIRKKNYLKELNNRFINEYWPKLGVNIDRNYNVYPLHENTCKIKRDRIVPPFTKSKMNNNQEEIK